MTPFDPMLALLAKEAHVRPPHVFHCLAALRQMGAKFRPAVYAEFAGLELRHVERIMATLEAHDMLPKRAIKETQRGSRIADDLTLSADWKLFAERERNWDSDAISAEFSLFHDYWRSQAGQRGVKVDWFATWRNWVRNSRRPNGLHTPVRENFDARESLQRTAALYERMGRADEAREIRARLNSNIIPLIREAHRGAA